MAVLGIDCAVRGGGSGGGTDAGIRPDTAAVDSGGATASYADGVLRVELPKREPRERGVKVSVS